MPLQNSSGFVYSKAGLGASFYLPFSLLQEGETRCKDFVELNIHFFIIVYFYKMNLFSTDQQNAC